MMSRCCCSPMTPRRQSGGVRILLILCITVISSCQAAPSGYSGVFDGSAGRWVDLTHSFAESTIYWPTDTAVSSFRSSLLARLKVAGFTPHISLLLLSMEVRTWMHRFILLMAGSRMTRSPCRDSSVRQPLSMYLKKLIQTT